MNRLRIQIVAAITAAIGFILSLAYGGKDSPSTALKVYSFGLHA